MRPWTCSAAPGPRRPALVSSRSQSVDGTFFRLVCTTTSFITLYILRREYIIYQRARRRARDAPLAPGHWHCGRPYCGRPRWAPRADVRTAPYHRPATATSELRSRVAAELYSARSDAPMFRRSAGRMMMYDDNTASTNPQLIRIVERDLLDLLLLLVRPRRGRLLRRRPRRLRRRRRQQRRLQLLADGGAHAVAADGER